MKFKDLYEKFRNEEDCTNYIKQIREQEGGVFKKCGGRDALLEKGQMAVGVQILQFQDHLKERYGTLKTKQWTG